MAHSSASMNGPRSKGRPRSFDRAKALEAALRTFWKLGYEPASVPELCSAMGVNPPSMYAAFGSKATLFIEAMEHYERSYWEEPGRRFLAEPDLRRAVAGYFDDAARILLSPETPCGCMVVLAAVNLADSAGEVAQAVRRLRMATKEMFALRLRKAAGEGLIPPDTDIPALAGTLNALLEGLSLQARDGLSQNELRAMAAHAASLIPSGGPRS
ncbi:MAG: TetR/AcrR family transcriptional regulator [Desulfovibrio sp.]|nr:TetR/AcrR family transcriptional regulator [Desulfovibrio sp.]